MNAVRKPDGSSLLHSTTKLDKHVRTELFQWPSNKNAISERKEERKLNLNSNFIEDNPEFCSRSESGSPSEGFISRMTAKLDDFNSAFSDVSYQNDHSDKKKKNFENVSDKTETLIIEPKINMNSKMKKKVIDSRDMQMNITGSRINKELAYPTESTTKSHTPNKLQNQYQGNLKIENKKEK